MSFSMVKGRETRDKKVEVRAVPILDAEVVNDEDEKYRAGDVFKETGGGGFEEAEGGEKRDEAKVGKFARLLEAVHRLIDSKDDVGLAGGVSLDEGEKVKVGENSGRELLGKKFDILGRVEGSAEVKVRQVNGVRDLGVGYRLVPS